ncbi:hypothetical protein KU710_22550, partial [Salmonella enterica subsp. enterica serovar Give]|nr:hypothetical protein [Salmonella enterica subsp. enterica serovar Give]
SGKDYVVSMLDSLGKLAGAKTEAKGSYPGWQPDANSPVMHLVIRRVRSGNGRPNRNHVHIRIGFLKQTAFQAGVDNLDVRCLV